MAARRRIIPCNLVTSLYTYTYRVCYYCCCCCYYYYAAVSERRDVAISHARRGEKTAGWIEEEKKMRRKNKSVIAVTPRDKIIRCVLYVPILTMYTNTFFFVFIVTTFIVFYSYGYERLIDFKTLRFIYLKKKKTVVQFLLRVLFSYSKLNIKQTN